MAVDFNAGKTQLVLFYRSNNTGAIDIKMDGSVLEEKPCFRMVGLSFPSNLDWGSFILLRLLCISINLPYDLAWNMLSGLVLLATIWKC